MDIASLIARIEQAAPLYGAASWDKSGVQIAGRREQAAKCAVMLDPLPEQIAAALEWGAEFVLTHHPLSMAPRFLDRLDDYHRVAALVLGREAWLYAAHTSLDAQPQGPAGWLARELGLSSLQILEPTAQDAGFGLVGDLPEALAWEAFLERLRVIVGRGFWLQSGPTPARVRRVAYCTGSGGALLGKVFSAGADVYVTGDMKHHQMLEAKVAVLDVGHFQLEEEMMRRFAVALEDDLRLGGTQVKFFPGQDPQRLILNG
jgi:dinuclear metal center YbgI/SA1388 family protein